MPSPVDSPLTHLPTERASPGSAFPAPIVIHMQHLPSATDAPPSEAARLPSVLIVDDNEINRELLADYLNTLGFVVTAAHDGLTALDALTRVRPEVIIMDVQMPGMDGLEVTRRVRQLADPVLAATPIVGLTAMALRDDSARCLAAGMSAYRTKPFPIRSLPALLTELTRNIARR